MISEPDARFVRTLRDELSRQSRIDRVAALVMLVSIEREVSGAKSVQENSRLISKLRDYWLNAEEELKNKAKQHYDERIDKLKRALKEGRIDFTRESVRNLSRKRQIWIAHEATILLSSTPVWLEVFSDEITILLTGKPGPGRPKETMDEFLDKVASAIRKLGPDPRQSAVAKLLGCDPSYLRFRRKKLGFKKWSEVLARIQT